jgi:hypothetical protein
VALRLKRAALLAAMVVVGLNIWTGSPLAALWIGSRVDSSGNLTMGAVAAVAVSMLAISLGLIRLLGLLQERHDRLIGRPPPARRQQPWMRSLSGERRKEEQRRAPISALDVVLVAVVAMAVAAFEIWIFFFSGSSI